MRVDPRSARRRGADRVVVEEFIIDGGGYKGAADGTLDDDDGKLDLRFPLLLLAFGHHLPAPDL